VSVDVGVEFDVIGTCGIIMAALSDWRGGSGPRWRRALEARVRRVNRTVRLQPSNYQMQGLKTGTVRQYPRARPLFRSPKILSTPSRARSEGIGDSQLQEHGVGSPRILHVSPFSDYFSDIESIISSGRAMAILSEMTSSYKDARPSPRELRLLSLLLNHHTCQNRQTARSMSMFDPFVYWITSTDHQNPSPHHACKHKGLRNHAFLG
jgi:hypothetical protein